MIGDDGREGQPHLNHLRYGSVGAWHPPHDQPARGVLCCKPPSEDARNWRPRVTEHFGDNSPAYGPDIDVELVCVAALQTVRAVLRDDILWERADGLRYRFLPQVLQRSTMLPAYLVVVERCRAAQPHVTDRAKQSALVFAETRDISGCRHDLKCKSARPTGPPATRLVHCGPGDEARSPASKHGGRAYSEKRALVLEAAETTT